MAELWTDGTYSIDDAPDRIDMGVVHSFLSRAYWSPGISRELVEQAVRGSMPFGIYQGDAMIGFARLVTDRVTFAYMADVFVLEAHRGLGLSKALVAAMLAHPELQLVRRWMLATKDTQGLYKRFGFAEPGPGASTVMQVTKKIDYTQLV